MGNGAGNQMASPRSEDILSWGLLRQLDGSVTAEKGGMQEALERQKIETPKTYSTRDSLVVTDPTTSLALTSLSRGERTGSRVL